MSDLKEFLNREAISEILEKYINKILSASPLDEDFIFSVLQSAHADTCFPSFHRINDDQQEYLEGLTSGVIALLNPLIKDK